MFLAESGGRQKVSPAPSSLLHNWVLYLAILCQISLKNLSRSFFSWLALTGCLLLISCSHQIPIRAVPQWSVSVLFGESRFPSPTSIAMSSLGDPVKNVRHPPPKDQLFYWDVPVSLFERLVWLEDTGFPKLVYPFMGLRFFFIEPRVFWLPLTPRPLESSLRKRRWNGKIFGL